MPQKNEIPARLRGRAFTLAEGAAEGMSEWRLRTEDTIRPFRGVRTFERFTPQSGHPFELQREMVLKRCRDYLPVLRNGHFFSHHTAAAIWNVPLPSHVYSALGDHQTSATSEGQILLHLSSIAPTQEPRTAGVVGHKTTSKQIRPTEHNGLPVTDPVSTLFTLAAATRGSGPNKTWLLTIYDLVAAADNLVQVPAVATAQNSGRPLTTIEEITARVLLFRGKGKQRLMEALPHVRVGSESRMESLLRLHIVDSGLPEPQLNRNITDAEGVFIGRADLVYPEFRLIVEYDGDQHRTDPILYENDIYRVERFENEHWTFLRVRRKGLFVEFEKTRARIEHALRQGGWTP